MKKISKYIFLLGLGAVTMTSCNMDTVPNYSVTYEEGDSIITSKDFLEKMENGIISSFRSCQYNEFSQTEEVACDGFNATLDYGNNYGGVHRMDNSFNSSDYYVRDFWLYNYSAIKNYNVYISALETYNPTTAALKAEAKVCKGEAYFFRAASYLQLARHFAKAYNASSASNDLCVPIVLKYNQAEKPSRGTVKAVYDQIKLDLDEAATDLATVNGTIAAQKPTIDAVNALYARYYLDIADYANAALYAMKVINSSAGYKVSATADAMTAEYTNDSGTEPILQLYASLSESGLVGNNSIYTQASYDSGVGVYFTPWFLPSQKLIDVYDASDLRLKTWFANNKVSFLGGNLYYKGEFYIFTKYLGNPALRTGSTPNARQFPKPFLIGEMYLIAAEAYFKGGSVADAKTQLNALQAARGASLTEATMSNIQKEWFKETVGEGLRLSCIKRWAEGFTARTSQAGAVNVLMSGESYATKSMTASDIHLVWPIPTYELKVNPNLVQNDGYGTSD